MPLQSWNTMMVAALISWSPNEIHCSMSAASLGSELRRVELGAREATGS